MYVQFQKNCNPRSRRRASAVSFTSQIRQIDLTFELCCSRRYGKPPPPPPLLPGRSTLALVSEMYLNATMYVDPRRFFFFFFFPLPIRHSSSTYPRFRLNRIPARALAVRLDQAFSSFLQFRRGRKSSLVKCNFLCYDNLSGSFLWSSICHRFGQLATHFLRASNKFTFSFLNIFRRYVMFVGF